MATTITSTSFHIRNSRFNTIEIVNILLKNMLEAILLFNIRISSGIFFLKLTFIDIK